MMKTSKARLWRVEAIQILNKHLRGTFRLRDGLVILDGKLCLDENIRYHLEAISINLKQQRDKIEALLGKCIEEE